MLRGGGEAASRGSGGGPGAGLGGDAPSGTQVRAGGCSPDSAHGS